MIGGCLTTVPDPGRQDHPCCDVNTPSILAITLVMLVWGVASEALRDIITGFLNQVRFD
jgi:hypothetical protein